MTLYLLTIILLFGCVNTSAELPAPGSMPGQRAVLLCEGLELPFRWCPAGTFTMGSPDSESGRDAAEVLHRVTLTQGFWMLETEVSQELYQKITGQNPSYFQGKLLPVDSVSWNEADAFCQQMSERCGKSIALPTESQWEYAARAGTETPWFGNLAELAWSGEETATGSTHPVATKKPNAWGLYDMHGNLWEWCRDRWTDYTTDPVTDPEGATDSYDGVRIDRGGCWDSSPEYCRSAHRGVYERDRKSKFVGFRIILIPTME